MTRTMKIILFFVLLGFVSANAFGFDLALWPRGNNAYLVQNYDMPVWPQIPNEAIGSGAKLVLTIEMPKGFDVSKSFGQSTAFAVQPNPLMLPEKIESKVVGQTAVVKIVLPNVPADKTADSLNYSKDAEKSYRLAILINPGSAEVGSYPIKMLLKTCVGKKSWSLPDAQLTVLAELKGKRPQRLRTEAFDYAGYTNDGFKNAIIKAVQGSGINVITNMRLFEQADTVAQLLKDKGVRASWIMFWHNLMPILAEKYPDVYPVNAKGEKIVKPDFLLKNNICHTFCIDNREEIKAVIKDYFKKNVIGRYNAVTNDNEEKAAARDKSFICGDTYTPVTMAAFKKFAALDVNENLTPEIITKKYIDKWIDFRCSQSAQMSAILSEAIAELDPSIEYGYYSGHKYVGNLAGFSRAMYATDWDLLAEEGGIAFGSSGYYGSTADYTATSKALGNIPHVPAEMYIENFLDFNREMPKPEIFKYRLMKSLMYGSGGFAVWYLQVLDGAGYYAISEISAIAAELEDYLLDGADCADQLLLPHSIDKKSVFAYQLGQKRAVVVFNHSAKKKKINIGWKKPIRKPDTVEIVTGRNLADTKVMDAELEPKDFAVFVTLSQGN